MTFERFIRVMAIFLFSTLGFAQQQSSAPANRPEDQVKQVEADWLAADSTGDTGSLRRIIADDFIGSSFDGSILSKHDVIPENSRPGGFAGAAAGETNVRIFGETGVLMGVISTPAAGGQGPKHTRVTLVCQKREQGWQIIAAQLSR